MFQVQRRPFRAVISAALGLGFLVSGALAVPSMAQDAIDRIVTGAVSQAAPAARERAGSAAFRGALDLVASGKYAEAYAAARGLGDAVERRTVQWAAIHFGGDAVDHASIARFAADAPDFASPALYRTRIEQALLKASPDADEIIRRLGGEMPRLIEAQIALASAYVADGQTSRAGRIARDIWVNNFLDTEQEAAVLAGLGPLLDRQAHWDRAVHLLMHDRATATERIMQHLSPAQKTLALARMAVARKEGNAQALIDKVDPSLRDHPLFWFTRAQLARNSGNLAGAVGFLDRVKGTPPDATEFWDERHTIIRRYMAAGDHADAYKAAAGYVSGPEGRLVEARFLAGLIALTRLKDSAAAASHFAAMAELATLPDSITQARYWHGRALAASGDRDAARAQYAIAAQYPVVYYGQLAREALGQTAVTIRPLPSWQPFEARFEQREIVQAIRLMIANQKTSFAEPLLRTLAAALTEGGEMVLAARLAQDAGAHNVAIMIADIAGRRGTPMDLFHFPRDGLPSDVKLADLDRAAVYAVTRQESLFRVGAVSSAGARGLMQLMPGTAKETAGKLGVPYSPDRLVTDAHYNALLGSTYLAQQLDRFDGSLVLAAAGYNAGPGNASKWITANGDPRDAAVDPVAWIEAIPFAETRKYVQRVMGNYMVYRARLGGQTPTLAEALRRIPH